MQLSKLCKLIITGSSGAVARVMMGSATQLATFAQTRKYIINSKVCVNWYNDSSIVEFNYFLLRASSFVTKSLNLCVMISSYAVVYRYFFSCV